MRRPLRRLHIDCLETRALPAPIAGVTSLNVFPNKGTVTYSIVPDATVIGSVSSNLRASMASNPSFESQVDSAFAIWGSILGVNFVKVGDDGAALGSDTTVQGSASRGDIRIAGYGMGAAYGPGYAWNPPPLVGTSLSSDVLLNTNATWGGTGYNLTTAVVHEVGHALGLDHTTDPNSVMYPTLPVSNTFKSPNATDIADGQSLFPVSYDSYGATTSSTPIVLSVPGNYVATPANPTKLRGNETKWFSAATPSYTTVYDTNAVITASSAGLSNLTPVVNVYNSSNVLIASAQSSSITGDTVAVTLPSSAIGAGIKISVAGRTNYAIAGSFSIKVSFGEPKPATSTSNPYTKTYFYSFVPDGTAFYGGTSSLNSFFSGVNFSSGVYAGYGANSYRDIVRLAMQSWSSYGNVNFVEVADSSSNTLRIGAVPFTGYDNPDALALGGSPSFGIGGVPLSGGILLLNTLLNPASNNYLQTTIHELGHTLGLSHNSDPNSVMYYMANGKLAPVASDISDLVLRFPWAEDWAGPNNHSYSQATVLNTTTGTGFNLGSNYFRYSNLTLSGASSATAEDWYWIHPPTTASKTMTVSVQASNQGLLAPIATFYTSTMGLIGSTVQLAGGSTALAVLGGVSNSAASNNGYFVKIARPASGVGSGSSYLASNGFGAYSITVDFGANSTQTAYVGSGTSATPGYLKGQVESGDDAEVDAVNAELIALALTLMDDEDQA